MTYYQQLLKNGYVVYPVFTGSHIKIMSELLEKDLLHNPYIDPKFAKKYAEDPACTAFGALCTEFHSLHNRIVRSRIANVALQFFTSKSRPHAYSLPDRTCVRVRPSSGESLHRDNPSKVFEEYGVVLGGWVAICGEQTFRCVPGSHWDKVDKDQFLAGNNQIGKSGFTHLTKDEKVKYRDRLVNISIPPGYGISFFSHIVHAVAAKTNRTRMTRVFTGILLANKPFGDYYSQFTENFDVYPLPSGQTPWVWEKLSYTNWIGRLEKYCEMFHPNIPRRSVKRKDREYTILDLPVKNPKLGPPQEYGIPIKGTSFD
jgi:hypothetical protein